MRSAEAMGWPAIAARLAMERTYWLNTVARDGGPHVSPVWGAVVDDVWFCYSERHTVKARNVAADPRVAIHLDGGEDVLIVYGTLVDLVRPQARPDVVEAFDRKYDSPQDQPYLPSADPSFDVLYALEPRSAMAWQLSDYDATQRRWAASKD